MNSTEKKVKEEFERGSMSVNRCDCGTYYRDKAVKFDMCRKCRKKSGMRYCNLCKTEHPIENFSSPKEYRCRKSKNLYNQGKI